MNISPSDIIPITAARSKLGNLADKVTGEYYILLTKGGNPKAILVDPKYFKKLQNEVGKIYKKTFIDPKLLPLTREFTDKEINEWEQKDKL